MKRLARTQIRGEAIADGSVKREDLDVTTAGSAVIRKVIAGTGVTITQTGPDAGTGDVTINATGGGGATNIDGGSAISTFAPGTSINGGGAV